MFHCMDTVHPSIYSYCVVPTHCVVEHQGTGAGLGLVLKGVWSIYLDVELLGHMEILG